MAWMNSYRLPNDGFYPVRHARFGLPTPSTLTTLSTRRQSDLLFTRYMGTVSGKWYIARIIKLFRRVWSQWPGQTTTLVTRPQLAPHELSAVRRS